jgi:hypothetical protein
MFFLGDGLTDIFGTDASSYRMHPIVTNPNPQTKVFRYVRHANDSASVLFRELAQRLHPDR